MLIDDIKSHVKKEVDYKYSLISRRKFKRRAYKLILIPVYPVLLFFRFFRKMLGRIIKMKRIGFPFRYLKVLSKIVSYVKRIEELERQNAKLELELIELKKQWFSGKV